MWGVRARVRAAACHGASLPLWGKGGPSQCLEWDGNLKEKAMLPRKWLLGVVAKPTKALHGMLWAVEL